MIDPEEVTNLRSCDFYLEWQKANLKDAVETKKWAQEYRIRQMDRNASTTQVEEIIQICSSQIINLEQGIKKLEFARNKLEITFKQS